MINIFVLVTILGHLPVILFAKRKGSEDMKQILIVEDDSFLNSYQNKSGDFCFYLSNKIGGLICIWMIHRQIVVDHHFQEIIELIVRTHIGVHDACNIGFFSLSTHSAPFSRNQFGQ